jgi:hypothetical protein
VSKREEEEEHEERRANLILLFCGLFLIVLFVLMYIAPQENAKYDLEKQIKFSKENNCLYGVSGGYYSFDTQTYTDRYIELSCAASPCSTNTHWNNEIKTCECDFKPFIPAGFVVRETYTKCFKPCPKDFEQFFISEDSLCFPRCAENEERINYKCIKKCAENEIRFKGECVLTSR